MLPIIAFFLLNLLYIDSRIQSTYMEEKKEELIKLVNTAISMTSYYYSLEQKGDLTNDQAQSGVKDAMKAIRTGEGIQDYFWIHDYQPKMIAHPFRLDLEGEDLSTFEDPDGARIFVEMVELAKGDDNSFISYKWEYILDSGVIVEPKISYVAAFEPWEWIIGTGINVNEMEKLMHLSRRNNTILASLVAIIFAALVVFLSGFVVK